MRARSDSLGIGLVAVVCALVAGCAQNPAPLLARKAVAEDEVAADRDVNPAAEEMEEQTASGPIVANTEAPPDPVELSDAHEVGQVAHEASLEPTLVAHEAAPEPTMVAPTEALSPLESPAPNVGAESPTISDDVILIDSGSTDGQPRSLAEAANAERLRRRQSGSAATIVITDANLEEYAIGQLTEATPSTPEPGESEETVDAYLDEVAEQESYWREAVLAARISWQEATSSVDELEGAVGELRRRFYAEDDGFYRDSQIKPAWDRSLDELAEAKRQVVRSQEELDALLEEGRRAGALPGWLREGLEHEPQPRQPIDPSEPGEPRIVGEERR